MNRAGRCAGLLGALACLSCKATETPPRRPFELNQPTLLSTGSPTKDEDPFVLRAHDGTIIVTWFSDRGSNPDIYVTSTKNGRDWTPTTRVTTSPDGDFYPNLYQDAQGLFHLTWFRWSALYVGHIMYNTSADGVSWTTTTEVQATKAFNVDDWVPSITQAPDGTLLIYFASKVRNTTTPQYDLYLAAKPPGATDWNAVVGAAGLNSPSAHDNLPIVARTGSNVSIVWVRYDLSQEVPWLNPKSDLWYATSANGITWTTPAKITTDAGNVVHLYPAFFPTLDDAWWLIWLSTRSGSVEAFELPLTSVAAYPQGVVGRPELQSGYSHRIAPTSEPGVYIGVWVQGPEGAQDIYYRFFQR